MLYQPESGNAVVGIGMNSPSDIYFFIDDYGPGEELIHYNGARYKRIKFSNNNYVIYGDAFAIKDLAIHTGFWNNKAYMIIVKRKL